MILARAGVCIENWPKGIRFPGSTAGKTRKRGLKTLPLHEREELLRAFDDPLHPLIFKTVDSRGEDYLRDAAQH